MAGRAQGFRLDRREFLLGFPLFFWRKPKAKIADAEFRAVRHGQARRHYIWIHGNEETAKVVLSDHMRVREGRAFFTTSHIRNVRISNGVIDPNRMFSRDGAERNLRTLNPRWTDGQLTDALSRLDKDREKFLKQILPENGRVLVALHNNSSAYSVKDEVPISDEVSLKNPGHPREFILCTMKEDFDRLSRSPFNVVLQLRAPKVDDGSLSRICALRGIRYVNIEAALGNFAEQVRMLNWVESALPG